MRMSQSHSRPIRLSRAYFLAFLAFAAAVAGRAVSGGVELGLSGSEVARC